MENPPRLEKNELQYYYLPHQLEGFSKTTMIDIQQRVQKSIRECCDIPGAINIPVGIYGSNAPNTALGNGGVACLEKKGIRGVNAWTLSAVCRQRDALRHRALQSQHPNNFRVSQGSRSGSTTVRK